MIRAHHMLGPPELREITYHQRIGVSRTSCPQHLRRVSQGVGVSWKNCVKNECIELRNRQSACGIGGKNEWRGDRRASKALKLSLEFSNGE
jgi:hypothetical protein